MARIPLEVEAGRRRVILGQSQIDALPAPGLAGANGHEVLAGLVFCTLRYQAISASPMDCGKRFSPSTWSQIRLCFIAQVSGWP